MSPTREDNAKAESRSWLYWAIPPWLPNASVTSARTRRPFFGLPLNLPSRHRPSAVTNGNAVPQAKERSRIDGMRHKLAAT